MGPLKFFQVVGAPPAVSEPGYPLWQSTPIISGGSGLEPTYRLRSRPARWWKRVRLWWHRLGRYVPEHLWLWWVVTILLVRPTFRAAQYSVRKVNLDPSMPKGGAAFQHMTNRSGLYHPQGENLVRHMEAAEWAGHWLREHRRSAPLWRTHLACELAYLALKERHP